MDRKLVLTVSEADAALYVKGFPEDDVTIELLADLYFLVEEHQSAEDRFLFIVTAAQLYEAVWGEKFLSGSGNTVMVHVLNVRRKIEENPSSPRILRTVWGRGYQID